jgi:hypothetical protein
LNSSRKFPRIAAAVALAICTVVALSALGGVGFAQNGGTAGQYQYGKKVTICHKGHTITVGKAAVPAHLRHGDALGSCATVAAKKAAKAKAEKSQAQESQKPAKGKGQGK